MAESIFLSLNSSYNEKQERKGYSTNWGWLGLLSLLCLSILLIIPSPSHAVFLRSSQEENLVNNPFDKINISELLLTLLIALPVLYYSVLAIACLAIDYKFDTLVKNSSINNYLGIITFIYWIFALFAELKKAGIVFNKTNETN